MIKRHQCCEFIGEYVRGGTESILSLKGEEDSVKIWRGIGIFFLLKHKLEDVIERLIQLNLHC